MGRKVRQVQTNSKLEIRNSKQFQIIKIGKILNKLASDSVFWIFPIGGLFVSEFVSDFDIRISDFVARASWRTFPEVIL